MGRSRFVQAIAAIDAANAGDPNTIDIDGVARPKEQAHAEMMTAWVQRLDPDATELQLLAARAHHLRRWSVPRETYPDGRGGYLRWRTALKAQHAAEVGDLLRSVGYEPDEIDRVQRIIRKENLKHDPQVQTHEDALCLVFVETQLLDLAAQLGDEKSVDVVAKTLVKMSDRAIAAALELPLDPEARTLLERAAASR